VARADEGLAFLLRYENVARYDDGEVTILDRRVYPARVEYVRCANYAEVAQAITDMVTQSGGPWLAAAWGMVSAARAVHGWPVDAAKEELERAVQTMANARPTRVKHMESHLRRIQRVVEGALASGRDVEAAATAYVEGILEQRYLGSRQIATHAVSLLPDHCTILTQCFAETLIGYTLLVAQEHGKAVSLICPETRPYLQGARLTASVAQDMGVPVTVITDNMPAYVLSQGMVDIYMSAADLITLDGHVVNKVGTFQIALAAHHHSVPYYVTGRPSPQQETMEGVRIEQRNPEDVLQAMGVRTTMEGVQGLYPAFDVTPPHLVSAVVTPKGVFSPYDLRNHFGPQG
jgi:methylthioribose-1-phosphate isomerase